MYKLLYGTFENKELIEECGTPSAVRKKIENLLTAGSISSNYLRIVGNGKDSIMIDFGSCTNFYFVEFVDIDFESFVKEFYK